MEKRQNDLSIYDTCAAHWWDARSPFSCSLRAVNGLCLEEILRVVGADLRERWVVDLGCGGGLLAQPLAQRGALVVASDLSKASVRIARASAAGARLHALVADACHPALCADLADLVLCADIFEHIMQWRAVLAQAAALLKPGGRIFVSTVTRTWLAIAVGVHVAEAMGYVPRGTHDPGMLVRPREVVEAGRALGLVASAPLGVTPRWWRSALSGTLQLRYTKGVFVSYILWLAKSPAALARSARASSP